MSSSDIALSVRGLGKSYTIAHGREHHVTLAEALLARMKNPLKRLSTETFWALRDISFEIKKGEVVGVIGRNGAGKSTLLKVLSRITEPTTGEIDVYGRIGSLLEVGTGFHPELTGRENIYLNGAILGMSRPEISRQFDAIVEFAGVERFLDTPVKRYSSGMYVRLAFAVAAHLRSEILIVDEVLAVGDTAFQRKCLGKMQDVASDGRTVLLVSHQMSSIHELCSSALLLDQGRLVGYGAPDEFIAKYRDLVLGGKSDRPLRDRRDRSGTGAIRLTGFAVRDSGGRPLEVVPSGQDIIFCFDYETNQSNSAEPLGAVDIGFSFGRGGLDLLGVFYSSYVCHEFNNLPTKGTFYCRVSRFPFAAGIYRVGARILCGGMEADWPREGIADLIVTSGKLLWHGPGRPRRRCAATVHRRMEPNVGHQFRPFSRTRPWLVVR